MSFKKKNATNIFSNIFEVFLFLWSSVRETQNTTGGFYSHEILPHVSFKAFSVKSLQQFLFPREIQFAIVPKVRSSSGLFLQWVDMNNPPH